MNVLAFYGDRMETVSFRDTKESVLVLRRGNSMAPKTIANGKVILAERDTAINNGELITRDSTGEQFLIIAKQHSVDATQMQGRRVNGVVDVIKFEDVYEHYVLVDTKPVTVASEVPICYSDISASMKQHDAGLLQTTVKKIIIQPTVDVKLLYRIVLNGRNYKVTNVNTAAYVNLVELQVAEDNR